MHWAVGGRGVGGPFLFAFHPLLMVARHPGSGGQPRGVGSQPANTQLQEPGLKMSPRFLCGKAEPPKDKTVKQGTPTRDHCLRLPRL